MYKSAAPINALFAERLISNRAITFKADAIDNRVFNHGDNQPFTFPTNGDIGKKTRREERFNRLVNQIRFVFQALTYQHIGKHGFLFDTLRAFNADKFNRLTDFGACRRGKRDEAEEQQKAAFKAKGRH